MLKSTEWNTINNILLELYTVTDLDALTIKILKVLRMLIPYSHGYFLILDEKKKILEKHTCFVGYDKEIAAQYIQSYYEKDYLQFVYDIAGQTMAYKDTELLEKDARENTEFYKNYLKPNNMVYGCGIILMKNRKLMGILNFFRGEELGDFTEENMEILNVLMKHFENLIYNAIMYLSNCRSRETDYDRIKQMYRLTGREVELAKLIKEGMSNQEISDRFCVSLSTVKKHVYNLYGKTGVNSRIQLLNLFENYGSQGSIYKT